MFSSPTLEKGSKLPSAILGKGSIGSPVQYWEKVVGFPVQYWEKVVGSPVQYWKKVVGSPVQYWEKVLGSPVQYWERFSRFTSPILKKGSNRFTFQY